jgi:hypothetical protein
MHRIIAGFVFVMAAFPSNVNAAEFAGKLKNVDAEPIKPGCALEAFRSYDPQREALVRNDGTR